MNLVKKSIDKFKNLGTKELTPKESVEMMQNLIKTSKTNIQKELKPGTLIMFKYDAKDKSEIYDRTPFVMVLSKTSKYLLGVNFHWMPVSKRQVLVDFILKSNSKNIRNKRPITMSYKRIKGAVKAIGLYPVIRLYLRGRISKLGVRVPDELISTAAKMRGETFTQGKASSTTLWQRALQKYKTAKRKLSGIS